MHDKHCLSCALALHHIGNIRRVDGLLLNCASQVISQNFAHTSTLSSLLGGQRPHQFHAVTGSRRRVQHSVPGRCRLCSGQRHPVPAGGLGWAEARASPGGAACHPGCPPSDPQHDAAQAAEAAHVCHSAGCSGGTCGGCWYASHPLQGINISVIILFSSSTTAP